MTEPANPPSPSSPTTPVRRRRHYRRWLLAVGVLILLIVCLPQIILNQWGARLLGRVLSNQLQTAVSVEQVAGGWLSGLTVSGIEVAESTAPQAPTLLRVGNLTLNLAAVWLLASSDPIMLRVDALIVNLRRFDDGQWNAAALLERLLPPKKATAPPPTPASLPALPDRRVELALTDARLHVGQHGPYTVNVMADSASLAKAPLQWKVDLSSPRGATLAFRGQLQQVAKLAALESFVGFAEVNLAGIDLDVVTPLLRLAPALQPQGIVDQGQIRLDLAGRQGHKVSVDLDLRGVGFWQPDAIAEDRFTSLRVRVHGGWQGSQWSCDTLRLEAPGVRVSLDDRAWLHIDENAWRGHAAFSLEAAEMQPVSRVLRNLLPPALRLRGGLQIAARADGKVSRDAQQPLAARLADLGASLDGSLDGLTWAQDELSALVAKVRLQDGLVTIPQISAKAFGGDVAVNGELPLAVNAPGGVIDWRVTNLPLHKLLGEPLQHFEISRVNGRLTHDGKLYRLQSKVQFPELRLNPAEIDQREFRITQAAFRCTATFTWPFTQLDFDGCSIESPEMRLSLRNGNLVLGTQPQIGMQIKGSLSGRFVNALVPEVPVRFTHRLEVSGPYRIRLRGNVWTGMQWELAVSSKQFEFDDMTFTDLSTRVVKGTGQLDIAQIRTTRAQGHVEGAGGWRFPGKGIPAEGRLRLHAHRLPVHHPLLRHTPGGDYIIGGIIDGPSTVQTGRAGWQLTADHPVHNVRLRHGPRLLAELPVAHLHGSFGRQRDGLLWARQLELLGDDLKLTIHQGRLPIQSATQSVFEVEGTADVRAPWMRSVLALLQIDGIRVGGQTRVAGRLQGQMRDPLKTLQGEGSLRVTDIGLLSQTLSRVDVNYKITPGRLQISRGLLGVGDGTVEVQGNVGLPIRHGSPGDHTMLTLHHVPLEHTQQVQDFHGQGAATLSMHTRLDGQAALQVTPGGQLTGMLDVQVDEISRQVRQDDRVLEVVEVPPLYLTGQVSSSQPQDHWEIPSLRIQGQGIAVDLTHARVQWAPPYVDLSTTLRAHFSEAVSYGLTMGWLPTAFELKDTVDLEGTVGLRLPDTGNIGPQHLSYAGEVRLQGVTINHDTPESLTARINLAQGRLTMETAQANVLGGEVRLASTSFVDLQDPIHTFDAHVTASDLQLRVDTGKRLALSRFLFLLAPLFITEPQRDKPVHISGTLSAELALTGSFSDEPGWSKNVNGDGFFRIVDGAVLGSTLVTGLTTKTVTLPWNVVHNVLTGLFAADGRFGSAIAGLGKRAYVFGTIESPIQVRDGEVHLKPDFEVRSPEFGMTINGYSTLEGAVDYHVRTDLIERLRFGAITSLPNRIPIIGPVIRHVNPFTLLKGIELEATIEGNVFHTNAEGKMDVDVTTSIIR
jgi:hypothetical protein